MKPLREWLLERHAPKTSQLDAVRRRALAAAFTNQSPVKRSLWEALWQELFWSCRRIWTGFAVVWGLMLLVNGLWLWPNSPRPIAGVSAAAVIRAMAAQQQFLQGIDQAQVMVPAPTKAIPANPRREWPAGATNV